MKNKGKYNWIDELSVAATVCDKNGVVIYMNDKSAKTFEKDGGNKLIGKNLLECHPGKSKDILAKMLKNQTQNVYTIQKNGIKKMIYQTPWFENGKYNGFVEFSLEIPFEMPHFIRK